MKLSFFVSLFIFLLLTSCDNSKAPDKPRSTPKSLENKMSSFDEIVSKRGNDDLVENLYKELAEKTPELKELENKIDQLNNSRSDSAALFNEFDEKNQSYFRAANRHAELIKDSLLKEKMKRLIASSFTKYKASVSRHNNLLSATEEKYATLNDLHAVLKIVRTLPVIEKFEKNNLPSAKPLEGFLQQLSQTVLYADTLAKK